MDTFNTQIDAIRDRAIEEFILASSSEDRMRVIREFEIDLLRILDEGEEAHG